MKKKIILISFVIFFLVGCLVVLVNKDNKTIIIGDYILTPLKNNEIKYDYSFSMNELESSLLLEYLDKNAIDLKKNISINKYIKNSNKIYLSVGMNDLLNYVTLDDNKLNYNLSLISEKVALLEYNLHEIISSIKAIKDVDIYYFSLYYLNDPFDEIIYEYNLEIMNMLKSLDANYIEINNLINIEEYRYTSFNQRKIYDYMIEH